MRKNKNEVIIEGYVFDSSGLIEKVTSDKAKTPGVKYIAGEIQIAVDEDGLNVIPVHFSYVTEIYSRSKKPNKTFNVLSTIINNPTGTWIQGGKDAAQKVKVTGALGVNDFYTQDGELASPKRCEGSFVEFVNTLDKEDARNKFETDMLITKVTKKEASEENNLTEDYVELYGVVFDFRNAIFPVTLICKNEKGMEYFESQEPSSASPLYTKVWGVINRTPKVTTRKEESAFGEDVITYYERKTNEWIVTATAKFPYEFGEEGIMTAKELETAIKDREVYLADKKKAADEYQKNKTEAPASTAAPKGDFVF